MTGNRKRSAADRRHFNSWYCQMNGHCRAQNPSARQVSDTDKWSQISLCHTIHDFVGQQSDLVLYVLWYPQPVETDQCISDVWCDQKTSAGRWALQLHSVLTAFGVWDRPVCRLTYCCRNQDISGPARIPASEECPSVLVDGSVVVDVGRRSTAILFVVRGSASNTEHTQKNARMRCGTDWETDCCMGLIVFYDIQPSKRTAPLWCAKPARG